MNFHQATINDLDSLTELFDFYRLFYKQASDLIGAKKFLEERFQKNESVIFIAYDNGEPVGFTQLFPSFSSVSMQKSWVLNDLYVKETARRKGVAKELINKAIGLAEETKAKGILLETGKENVNAQKLYETIGFTKDSSYYYYYSL
ncbi:GNAT family N-acetyltransferase [Psychrobacillus sp. FSL K6-2836]|uniref:GNAT family N-acetyltransferase n=1 Tax=Psychrobacillus sp. FSL K6-2836 TaxID=2921548 RepID=UPI0030FAD545